MFYRQLAPSQKGSAPHHFDYDEPIESESPLREQDRLLPMANVARLMAYELPPGAKIARESKVLMQELMSEFLCFVTAEASEISLAANHKAVTMQDCSAAMKELDLGFMLPCMDIVSDIQEQKRGKQGKESHGTARPTPYSSPLPPADQHGYTLPQVEPQDILDNEDILAMALPSLSACGSMLDALESSETRKRDRNSYASLELPPMTTSSFLTAAYDGMNVSYGSTSSIPSTRPASPGGGGDRRPMLPSESVDLADHRHFSSLKRRAGTTFNVRPV